MEKTIQAVIESMISEGHTLRSIAKMAKVSTNTIASWRDGANPRHKTVMLKRLTKSIPKNDEVKMAIDESKTLQSACMSLTLDDIADICFKRGYLISFQRILPDALKKRT